LSNQGGFYRSHAYIAEIRRMRLFTVGPDINLSQWKYYGKERAVVIGLMAIKGLSLSGARAVIDERECNGNFASLNDFSRRVKLNRDDIIALCPAGVFDSIAEDIPRYLQARRLLANNNEQIVNKKGNRNLDLFSAEVSPAFDNTRKSVIAPQVKKAVKNDNDLWEEYNTLGFLRNTHPLALWKDDVLAVKHRVKALYIEEYIGRNVKMIGWPVTQKDVWTKDGLSMCFLSLEDETALYETVVFPRVYECYNRLLFDQQPLLVFGLVSNDEGAVSLEINRIEVLEKQAAEEIQNSIKVNTLGFTAD
jgi:DNA polymerase-3 subunit alpha/error-prone DNA polymerase